MTDFVRTLCRDHVEWIDDASLGGSPPMGWRPLVRALFEGMRIAMADVPGARVSLARLEAAGDRLYIEIRDGAGRPTPTPVLMALERMIAEAEQTSSETCAFCGRDFGLGAGMDGRLARHVGSRPTCHPTPAMRHLLQAAGDL
jgi:hypothetical protein